MSEETLDGVKIQKLPTYGRPYSIKTRKQGRRGAIDGLQGTGIRGKAKKLSEWRKKNHPEFKKEEDK